MKKYPVDGARERGRSLRQNMTEAEWRLWQILRSHQIRGHKFRRQVPIGRYIADFVCHEARLIVEVDGGHQVIVGELRGITPTQTLPHQGGGILPTNNPRSNNT